MGHVIIAVRGRVGHFVMLCHRYPQSRPVSGVQLAQSVWKGNALRAARPRLSGHSEGQLSRIQRARLSSLPSPAARERMMAVAYSGLGLKPTPFFKRKTRIAIKATRLLPSTNA